MEESLSELVILYDDNPFVSLEMTITSPSALFQAQYLSLLLLTDQIFSDLLTYQYLSLLLLTDQIFSDLLTYQIFILVVAH